jgi:glycylpeptide N-tetradecanoyltransferase
MPHAVGGRQHPEGPIVPDKKPEEIRAEPYNMPTGFEWSALEINDATQREELYTLLANNYVEDDDCLFRFDYSKEFLEWALTPPGFCNEFLLGVRTTAHKKLVAFISAVPATISVYQKGSTTTPSPKVVEINFLCVHKKLRSKRLAPVLIKEITRRVNKSGVFQAVYTAGVVLPVPVASARYHHRSLDPKKLVRVGFSRLSPRMTMARMQKLYKLPQTPDHNLVPMTKDHVQGVFQLLKQYLSKFSLHISFSQDEVAHWLLPREKVINSYVICNAVTGDVTDFCSFYHLPSSILGKDETLHAAYSFYNVATSISLTELMRDALILANHQCGSDVFNALNLMENDEFLDELKFGKGDGNLQYYIYNWACTPMKPSDVGIVLL